MESLITILIVFGCVWLALGILGIFTKHYWAVPLIMKFDNIYHISSWTHVYEDILLLLLGPIGFLISIIIGIINWQMYSDEPF